MIKEALSNYPMSILNVFALVIFFLIFLGMLAWVYRKDSVKYYEKTANLPLED